MKKKIIIAALLLCVAAAIGCRYFYYCDGYKRIDLHKTWPKGQWLEVQFVEINFGEEFVNFEIPKDKLGEFEQTLKQEVKHSGRAPISDLDQLRIITTKGKYYTRVLYDMHNVLGETWQSDELRDKLYDYGFGVKPPPDPNVEAALRNLKELNIRLKVAQEQYRAEHSMQHPDQMEKESMSISEPNQLYR
jgi:hypothetical protein